MKELSNTEFLEMYEQISDKIFRTCYFKTGDRDIALDLTQETFMRVWTCLSQGQKVDNLTSFSFTVARNLIKDHYKKKKSVPLGKLEDFDPLMIPDTSARTHAQAEVEHILSLLSRLSLEDQDLLRMRIIEELTPKEIALRMGERENTVAVRIHRALKRYRSVIQGQL